MGYQVRGFLSGFSALYAMFTLGSLGLFILVLKGMSSSWIQDVLLFVFGGGFIGLVVYAVIRERKHPETFAVKETQEINLTITQEAKSPNENTPRQVISSPTPPTGQLSSANRKEKPKV